MYKLKPGAVLPNEFKIKVNPEQSETIQRHLFFLGYQWPRTGKKVQLLDKDQLYAINSYSTKVINYGVDTKYFETSDRELVVFEDYFEKESRAQLAYRLSITTPYTTTEILSFMKFFEDKDLDKAISFIGASHDIGLPDLQSIIYRFEKIKKS